MRGTKNYCSKCDKYECEEQELQYFLQYLNKRKKKTYHIVDCPDKSGEDYNCDLVIENEHSEKIYIEMKRVLYGFYKDQKKEPNIPETKGQLKYSILINDIIKKAPENTKKSLNKYIVTIPPSQIDKNDKTKFAQEFESFLNRTEFNGKDVKIFEFKREREEKHKLKIIFEPKSTCAMPKFPNSYIPAFQYKNNVVHSDEEGISLLEMHEHVNNIEDLIELLKQNCKNTSSDKFPKTNCRKILLNILRFPIGYDIVFERDMHSIIRKLEDNVEKFKCAADEIYLVYYAKEFAFDHYKKYGIYPGDDLLFIWQLHNKNGLNKIDWSAFKR